LSRSQNYYLLLELSSYLFVIILVVKFFVTFLTKTETKNAVKILTNPDKPSVCLRFV